MPNQEKVIIEYIHTDTGEVHYMTAFQFQKTEGDFTADKKKALRQRLPDAVNALARTKAVSQLDARIVSVPRRNNILSC